MNAFCWLMERHRRWVLALMVAGMLGFAAACAGVALYALDGVGYLIATAASLGAYAAGLAIGYLGDPFEQQRRQTARRRGRAQEAAAPRQLLQTPSSSWTWPVRWKPNLSATSR